MARPPWRLSPDPATFCRQCGRRDLKRA